MKIPSGSGGGVSGGPDTTGLAGEHDASARTEQTAQLAELLRRMGPEPKRVHATMASRGLSKCGNRSTDVCSSVTRWARMAAALRLRVGRTVASEWSMP